MSLADLDHERGARVAGGTAGEQAAPTAAVLQGVDQLDDPARSASFAFTPATLLRAGCPRRVCQGDVRAVVQEQLVDDVLMMGGEAATRDG